MKTSELNPRENEKNRLWRRYNRETVLIILICVSLAASVISWSRAEDAIDDAKEATAVAATWQTMYKETERECRLAQNDIDDFRIALFKAGIELEHTGETP